ncbi:hypothetical protein TNCV_240531 [Trichonephila clavipes]|nr:hypothetical protein TNCV_240531 [Trichonephila clavipes]
MQLFDSTENPSPNIMKLSEALKAIVPTSVEADGAFSAAGVFVTKGKSHEKWPVCAFKSDRTTSKRIRYGFITVKTTTLIGLNSPRKNTTLPAIKYIEPGRAHILV